MSGGTWIQSCDVRNKTDCCVTSDNLGSCCDNSTFEWTPGYIIAVINGDGTNRLTPYVDVNGSTQGATSMTASQASSSPISLSLTGGGAALLLQSLRRPRLHPRLFPPRYPHR